jgi:hypothetical protein
MSEEKEKEEAKEEIRKMSAKDKFDLIRDALVEKNDEMDSFEPRARNLSSFNQPQEAQKQESDVISAKAQHQGLRIGHAPETLQETEFPGLTENDKMGITIRHSDVPANVVPNIAMIDQMGLQTEVSNRILYEQSEIDLPQYYRNLAAEYFAKNSLKSVVNTLSAVEGKRQGSLERNLMSGKMAHETFQAEAKEKKQGRLSRLRAYLNNEKE